jgi:hypothetical protein
MAPQTPAVVMDKCVQMQQKRGEQSLTYVTIQRYWILKAWWVDVGQLAYILMLTLRLGFAGNDSPSFVFPTAIATKGGPAGGAGGSGSGRPAVGNKPSFLTGGTGPGNNLSAKRGTEDLDFFIGDEALAAASGPGMLGDINSKESKT